MLTTFAMAQPLLALIGANPTFLVAHSVSGWQVAAYGVAIVGVPWVAAIVVEEVCLVLVPGHRRLVRLAVRALLLALAVAGPLNRAFGLDGFLALVVFGLAVGLAGLALFRVDRLRLAIRIGLFAPVAFLGGFLWASPAAPLFGPGQVAQSGSAGNAVSVVWLVFDQFPSAMLVDDQGEVRQEFPNFSRLAETSTWYPMATTVASDTAIATTSALTGRLADPKAPPVASAVSDSLFSLLAESHDVVAFENVTRLCPDQLCGATGSVDARALVADTRTLLVRAILPDAAADRLVPEIGTRWAFFDEAVVDTPQQEPDPTRFSNDDGARVDGFLESLTTMPTPSLRYLHLERPHEALLFLPDGRVYDHCSCYSLTDDGTWPQEPGMARQRLQRYFLQAMSVDTVLGQVMDELQRTGRFDDTMLVVMSDHGVALLPGAPNREVTPQTAPDVLPVPMFVKLPGMQEGARDDRRAQITDLLPTVLDVVAASSPPDLYGQSLTSPESEQSDPISVIVDGTVNEWRAPPDPLDSELVTWIDQLFPDPLNPYAFGPNAALLGLDPAGMVGEPMPLVATIATLEALANVATDSRAIPAHVIGELVGTDEPVELVVALNGRIAGMGTTFFKDYWQISLMVDPEMLVDGANTLELYAVVGSTLRPVELAEATG